LESSTVEIPDGDAGTLATIERMRALVNDRCSHPRIRALALSVIGRASSPDQQIVRLRSWLKSRIRFVADPDVTELLHDPVLLAEWIDRDGSVGVDCDDVAMMAAALGKAIGIAARFVVVGFFMPDAPYAHVWTELFDGRTWRELDTTRASQGIEDGRISRRLYVNVATGDQGEAMSGMVTTRRVGSFPNRQRQQLGWVAAVPVVISTIQQINSLFGGGKEPDRIKQNQEAERIALADGGEAGDTAARWLQCRSGRFGTCTIPGYPEQIGGWATQTAKDDAYTRWQNVSGHHDGTGTTTVQTPIGGGSLSNSTLLLAAGAAMFLLRRR
jgi:hypothetical protein